MKNIIHLMKSAFIIMLSFILIFAMTFASNTFSLDVNAATSYVSDNEEYGEGYIIIGESHAIYMALEASKMVDKTSKRLTGFESAVFKASSNSSFQMSGNLFFVFEGTSADEITNQSAKEYIYSDGNGTRGLGVSKIHSIIDKNPKIRHWNIISIHGESNITKDEDTINYYISSYKNWIDYEFKDATVTFLSHPTHLAYYSAKGDNANAFSERLSKEFGYRYIDFSDEYKELKGKMSDDLHFSMNDYGSLLVKLLTEARRIRVSCYDPNEVGFLILSECHSDVLLWSLPQYLEDTAFVTEVPKVNIVPLSSKSLEHPKYWAGGDTVNYQGIKYEANDVINNAMDEHPNVKFWYIVYFVGSNAVRNSGAKGTTEYMKYNVSKIDANVYNTDHTIALMTTPTMYGRGNAQLRAIDSYDSNEVEFMISRGMKNYTYDTRPDFAKYIEGESIRRYEFRGYRFGASGDGLHYYGKQYWTVATNAVNTIYKRSRNEGTKELEDDYLTEEAVSENAVSSNAVTEKQSKASERINRIKADSNKGTRDNDKKKAN